MTVLEIDFGSGDVFWGVFWLSMWGAWVWMVLTIFMQILRSPELSGVAKAIWTAVLLLLPLAGVLLYLCFRGARVGEDSASREYEAVRYAGPPHRPPTPRR